MNAIAHAGFNTIKIFIKGIDETANGYCNIKDLIKRAASYGLEVSFHCYLPCFKHPDESDAEEFFDSVYGELFRCYPEVASISLVGESLEFPSCDPFTTGKKWTESTVDGIPDSRPSPGWWPCCDYGDYLSCIERAIHKVNPEIKIYFSTYNWGYVSLEVRKNFLENILPEKIGLKVAFELFADKKINDLSCPVMDYTISNTDGSFYFKTECENAHRLGIETIVTTNTAGLTWDFGCVPYVPTPYKWIERIRALQRACKDWGIKNFYENHTMVGSPI